MSICDHLEVKILKLPAYCQANDWAGYDPYDALNSHVCRPAIPQLKTPSTVLNPGSEAKSNQYSQVSAYSKDPEPQGHRAVSVGIPQTFENRSD